MRRPMRRLYVAGSGEQLTYCTALTFDEAKATLGAECRRPDPDDIRTFWKVAKLESMSFAEVWERFGVSRQTVDGWWRKAGGKGLPRRRERIDQDRAARVRAALVKSKGIAASTIAQQAGASLKEVREMAEKLGIVLPSWHRRPSDDEMVEIARGKTWPEFAAAVGLRVSTLRAYVYKRPELSARLREVRLSRRGRNGNSTRVDPKKIKRLHKKGLSAYAISLQLGVEQMSVRYWIQKLALGGTHDSATCDGRPTGDAVGRSDGGAELQQG